MIPVAVSVPQDVEIKIEMKTENWAFGGITGKPVETIH